jgi:hypothetical protein
MQLMTPVKYAGQNFFCVPFTQALNLVSSRSCLVLGGKVHVPEAKVLDILVLSLDDSLDFFQRHFTAVTGEEFQKQYAYSLRHVFGKEGKREKKRAYGCSKIIGGDAPSAGQYHGCPYKHFDEDHLSQLLQQCNVGDASDRRDILRLKQSHQYQLACQKQFDVQHKGILSKGINLDNVGNHPNAWFRASLAFREKDSNMDQLLNNSTNDDAKKPANVSNHAMEVSP